MTDDITAGAPSVAKEGWAGAPLAPVAGRTLRAVQRVVFPGADLDVVPLYVETNPERGAAELHAEQVAAARGHTDQTLPPPPSGVGVATGMTQSVIRPLSSNAGNHFQSGRCRAVDGVSSTLPFPPGRKWKASSTPGFGFFRAASAAVVVPTAFLPSRRS